MAKSEPKLYTLSALSKKAGVSMPTLQRYKKLYQDRIPSVGEGRKQRYPEKAVKVIQEIKKENLKKRGRPRKAAADKVGGKKGKPGRKPAAAKRTDELLTLSEVGRRTGISYPTLLRYVKLHGHKIPHVGKGRKRRYKPEAVEVFRELRAASPRGRRPKGAAASKPRKRAASADRGLETRVKALEASHRDLSKKLTEIARLLKKPIRVSLYR